MPTAKGRPPLDASDRRSARLSMRTYPAIAAKAAELGTAAVEALIRGARSADDLGYWRRLSQKELKK